MGNTLINISKAIGYAFLELIPGSSLLGIERKSLCPYCMPRPTTLADIIYGRRYIPTLRDSMLEEEAVRKELALREVKMQQEQTIRKEEEKRRKIEGEKAIKLKIEQEQNHLMSQVLEICRKGQLDSIPVLLQKMDDDHFYNALGSKPLAECPNADCREQVQKMLSEETQRREQSNIHVVASAPVVRT